MTQGWWSEMPDLVDDEVLGQIACGGTLEESPARVGERYGRYYDRAVPYLPIRRRRP